MKFPFYPRPNQHLNLLGRTFGSLTVIRKGPGNGKKTTWICRCTCGQECEKIGSDMQRKNRPITGCSRQCPVVREAIGRAQTTHGMSKHPAFAVWRSMNDRCALPTHQSWHNYGGRGITVCDRWQDSFESFWEDMGPTYRRGLDMDRRDNNGDYTPENCHWVTRKQNTRNRRKTLRPKGFPPDFWDIALAKGIQINTLYYRMKAGLTWEQIISIPLDCKNRFSTLKTAVPVTASPSEEDQSDPL